MSRPGVIRFPVFTDERGILSIFERGDDLPFEIQRVFTVVAPARAVRGQHAHKKCNQLLVCVHGSLRVSTDDGMRADSFVLDDSGMALFLPAGVWADQESLSDDTVLMVLCDRIYEADDYIRDHDEYLEFLGKKGR